MYIRFKNIKIQNFMSYGDATLQLDRGGFTLLQGYNNCVDDNAVSNGSGKSTIWDALCWCLTGDTIKGCKDITRHKSEGGTLVQLEFWINFDSYVLIRTKNHSKYKTNLKIFVNGEDKSGKGIKDSQEILNKLLPDLTSDLLGSVIILGQGMPNKFSNNTPSGRKAVLEKLSKSDFMIDELKTTVEQRQKEIARKIREAQDKLIELNTKSEQKTNLLNTCKSQLDTLLSSNITDLEDEVVSLTVEIDRLTDEVQGYESDKIYFERIIDSRQSELQTLYDTYVKEQENDTFDITQNIHNTNTKITKLTTEISSTQKEISRMKNIKDVCPTCGQKLPNVIKPDTSELENKIKELTKELDSEQSCLVALNKELKDKQEYHRNSYTGAKARVDDEIKTYRQSIVNLQTEISCNTNDILTFTKRRDSVIILIEDINSKTTTLQNNITTLESELSNIASEILYNTSEIENFTNHSQVVSKMQTYLQRDFRGVLLTNVISFINEKAKVYASQVFETKAIDIVQDGNNIAIRYLDKEYESLSGGEQKKIDIIVQLAIRQMLCTYLNFSCNLFVNDEIFDSLDTIGCQKIIDLMINELKDAGTVFIVSHRKDLPISVDNIVTVVKNTDGISTIIDK